jgi:hypothetical protein
MDFVPLLVMSATAKKVVDFVKYLTNMDVNALVTQVIAWAVGVGVTFLTASADFANGLAIGTQHLHDLSGWALTLIGVQFSSLAGIAWDTIKALDGTNSAIVPNLFPSTGPVITPGTPTSVDQPHAS